MIKNLITERQYKRTIAFLTRIRKECGIDTYLLMKNILTVGIITDYFETKYNIGYWISYETLFERNESLIKCGDITKEDVLKANNFHTDFKTFFGIPKIIVKGKSLTNVIIAEYQYWQKHLIERGINWEKEEYL